jgi:RNA polymerase sigma factor (sigma-70 family)
MRRNASDGARLPDDEATLVALWQQGDRAAGQELLSRHYRNLGKFFSWKVYGDAEDLVQETMAAAMSGKVRFEGRSSFGAYLLSIARFRLYEHYRQKRRDERVFDSSAEPSEEPGVSNVQPEPLEQVLILKALRCIPRDYQAVLELHYWCDLSGPEIAERLRLPIDTAYSRLRKAKALIRKKIELLTANER